MNTDFEIDVRNALRRITDHVADGTQAELAAIRAAGRKRSQRGRAVRRAGAAVSAVAAATLGGVVAFTGSPAAADNWRLAGAPEDMNAHILAAVKAQLPAGTSPTDVEMEAFSRTDGATMNLELGDRLSRSEWDRADIWRVTAHLPGGHRVMVVLDHAQGETEGVSRSQCAADLAEGFYTLCKVGSATASGRTLTTLETRSGALRRVQLAPVGEVPGGDAFEGVEDPSTVRPDKRYYDHDYEVQPGGDFLVNVSELVRAPTPDAAQQEMVLDTAAMRAIALDPRLITAG